MATYKSISKNFGWGSGFTGGDALAKISTSTASSDSVVLLTMLTWYFIIQFIQLLALS